MRELATPGCLVQAAARHTARRKHVRVQPEEPPLWWDSTTTTYDRSALVGHSRLCPHLCPRQRFASTLATSMENSHGDVAGNGALDAWLAAGLQAHEKYIQPAPRDQLHPSAAASFDARAISLSARLSDEPVRGVAKTAQSKPDLRVPDVLSAIDVQWTEVPVLDSRGLMSRADALGTCSTRDTWT